MVLPVIIRRDRRERRQHERLSGRGCHAPGSRHRDITPNTQTLASHADPPLERQAQRISASSGADRARPAVSRTLCAQTTAVKEQVAGSAG